MSKPRSTSCYFFSWILCYSLIVCAKCHSVGNVQNSLWPGVDSAPNVPAVSGEPLSPADYHNAGQVNRTSEEFHTDPIELAGLFEGDIILGRGEQAAMAYKFDNYNGSQDLDEESFLRNAILQETQKWPGGIIPYTISSQFNALERSVIARAILNYQSTTCIKFSPRATESDYINIIKGKGCSSHVGRTGGAQPLILGDGCVYTGIATHELMHAIGFWHEQSRWDRDENININFENISPGMDFNFRRYNWKDIQNLSAPYDTGSILHYGPYAFAKDKTKPTIMPKVANSRMGQRDALSQTDLLKINRLYNCNGIIPSGAPTPASSRPAAGQLKCSDSHVSCGKWAQIGECSKSSQWMLMNCRKSCNKCGSPCTDANQYCAEWSQNDECKRNPDYMTIYCAQSCGTCPHETTTETAIDNVVNECTDRHEHCEAWAARGECRINPQYMLTYCQLSCQVCVV